MKTKNKRKWDPSSDELLLSLYTHAPKSVLTEKFPDRTWIAIRHRAQLWGIKREDCFERTANIAKLTNGTPEAWYWLGFLWADGCNTDGALQLALAARDRNHLAVYGEFIEFSGKIKVLVSKNKNHQDRHTISVYNSAFCEALESFGLKKRKTYDPPELPDHLSGEQLDALICGFIDGDGSISTSGKTSARIQIHCHSSWLQMLKFFAFRIEALGGAKSFVSAKTVGTGKAALAVTRFSICQALKARAEELCLPVMERKWSKIDLKEVPFRDQLQRERERIVGLYVSGLWAAEICRITKLGRGQVQNAIDHYRKTGLI